MNDEDIEVTGEKWASRGWPQWHRKGNRSHMKKDIKINNKGKDHVTLKGADKML